MDVINESDENVAVQDDDTFYIPCEFCESNVPASDYMSHVNMCPSRFQTLIQFVDQEEGGVYRINIPNMIYQMIAGTNSNVVFTESNDNIRQMIFPTLIYMTPENVDMDEYEFNTLISERLGTVRVGVGDITKVTEPIDINTVPSDDICSICRETIVEKKPEVVLRTLCKHCFCSDCLSEWLSASKKCPLCMTDLTELAKPPCKEN